MAKSYTVCQKVICYDSFEAEDIPGGITPEQYAEIRYCDSIGDVDTHTLVVFEDDVVIYDGDEAFPEGVENNYDYSERDEPVNMTGRCGKVGKWTDDDGDEVTAVCIVVDGTHIRNLHASADLYWSDDLCVPTCETCDECSDPITDPITDPEDVVHCPDGKTRCIDLRRGDVPRERGPVMKCPNCHDTHTCMVSRGCVKRDVNSVKDPCYCTNCGYTWVDGFKRERVVVL